MRAIQVLLTLRTVVVPNDEILETLFVKSADWLREVAIHIHIFQVQYFRLKITEHPREDWVLREILKAPLGVRVQQE